MRSKRHGVAGLCLRLWWRPRATTERAPCRRPEDSRPGAYKDRDLAREGSASRFPSEHSGMRRTQTQSLVLVDVVALLGKKTVVYPTKRTMTSFDHAFMVVQGLSLLMAAAAAAGLPLRTKGSDRRKKSLRECLI